MIVFLQVEDASLATNAKAVKQLLSVRQELASFPALKRSSLSMPHTFAGGPERGVNLQVSIRSGNESGCDLGISLCRPALLEMPDLVQMLETRAAMDMGMLVQVAMATGLLADIELTALDVSALCQI